MSKFNVSLSPFIEIEDAWALAGIINRFAASFDAKEAFSLPEARTLFVLLVRAISAIGQAYPDELKELIKDTLLAKDDDSTVPDDSN